MTAHLSTLILVSWATASLGQGLDPAALHERYLRAEALAEAGTLDAASDELELLARKSPELADRCAFQAGLLDERRGALHRAAALLAQVSDESFFASEARLALARVLRVDGRFAEASAAAEWVAAHGSRADKRRALIELSTIATLAHDAHARTDALTRLATERTPWLAGAPVLAVISGSHDALLRQGACRDLAKAARRTPAELSCAAQLFIAEAGACEGRDVTPRLLQLINQCPQPELAARAWMSIGVVEARAGLAVSSAESFRLAASLAPTSPLAPEALFAAFWVGWKANPAEANVDDLARLDALQAGLGSQDRARTEFWRAKVAQARGDSADAAQLLAEVALRFPATWYGYLARERLTSHGAEQATMVELAALPAPKDDQLIDGELERLAPGIAAVELGLPDGPAELAWLGLRHPSPETNRVVVELLDAAGAFAPGHRFARAVFREQPGDDQDPLVWQAAFPTPFSQLIAERADAETVAPELLLGLVREESGFVPTARSHCGALGLMQLMPVTARSLARAEGAPLADLNELYEPRRNVELGSHYLGQLLRRFDGNRAAAAAAYNGGPSRVAAWLKAPNAGQLDEWVEEIPFDETRNYVKSVLASADVYGNRIGRRLVLATATGRGVGAL